MLTLPVLGVGSYLALGTLQQGVPAMSTDARVIGLLDSGHYMFEERPDLVLDAVLPFLG